MTSRLLWVLYLFLSEDELVLVLSLVSAPVVQRHSANSDPQEHTHEVHHDVGQCPENVG